MDYNTFIRRDLALLLYEYSIFNSLLKFHSSFYVYTLLTRWKKKKSFIFIYLSPDLIFLFLLFIYIQFEFRTILFFVQFPRTRGPKGKLSRGCEYNLLTKFFVHLLRLIFPRISYNFILCLEREIIHSSFSPRSSNRAQPNLILLIWILHYDFQNLLSPIEKKISPLDIICLKDMPVYSNRPRVRKDV